MNTTQRILALQDLAAAVYRELQVIRGDSSEDRARISTYKPPTPAPEIPVPAPMNTPLDVKYPTFARDVTMTIPSNLPVTDRLKDPEDFKLKEGVESPTFVVGEGENEDLLKELIRVFLQVNPNPSDKQFHMLADACGIDHETLEAISYSMLAGEHENEDAGRLVSADSQDILDGDYDPEMTPSDDLAMNDGDIANPNPGLQYETTDDGLSVSDSGLGVSTQDVLNDDGVVDSTF